MLEATLYQHVFMRPHADNPCAIGNPHAILEQREGAVSGLIRTVCVSSMCVVLRMSGVGAQHSDGRSVTPAPSLCHLLMGLQCTDSSTDSPPLLLRNVRAAVFGLARSFLALVAMAVVIVAMMIIVAMPMPRRREHAVDQSLKGAQGEHACNELGLSTVDPN